MLRWMPPSTTLFKINVDRVVFSAPKEDRVRAVICDELRRMVAALSKKIKASTSAI